MAIWDVESGEKITELPGVFQHFSDDGSFIIVSDARIVTPDGQLLLQFDSGEVRNDIVLSPNNKFLLVQAQYGYYQYPRSNIELWGIPKIPIESGDTD